MARIFVTQRLLPGAEHIFEGQGHEVIVRDASSPLRVEELISLASDSQALLCQLTDSISREIFEALPALNVVGTISVGTDHIDLKAAADHGVVVVNTPGVLDASTADLAIFLMLAALRRTSDAEASLRAGAWAGWGLRENLGRDLTGATVGLVGYGRIGQAVADRLAGFAVRVLHHTRTPTGRVGWTAALDELARAVDVLSIHVPHSPATTHLINESILRQLRPTAVLINTARGPIVDEEAVALALNEGRLWGAGFDVYEGEPSINPLLLKAQHTVLLPHIGSSTTATRLAMCRLAATGILEVLNGAEPANLVR